MEANVPPSSLLRTKFHRPPVTPVHVHRTHLLDRLDTQDYKPLTLICAPAGYGKSTLASCWLEPLELPSAWISVDESDNDFRLFLAYFTAAIQNIFPDSGGKLQTLLTSDELPPPSVLSGLLVNDLDKLNQTFILTIDDYHHIGNSDIHEFLEEILKHPPPSMRLMMLSRFDPPLPLPSLRARGLLNEIRAKDLRFSQQETTVFLQKMLTTPITADFARALNQKTEGWITGLHLAALTLRGQKDFDQSKMQLPDRNRYVMDYLITEILSQQPTDVQNALLRISILNRFSVTLCDAVLNPAKDQGENTINGEALLQLLKDSNLFVISLDEERLWFRFHHLFQNLLARKLEQRYKDSEICLLHSQAGAWYAENGFHADAIRHTLAAGDIETAVVIVGMARHDLMSRDQWHVLERWLNLFPHGSIEQYPDLILTRCWLDLYHWYRLDSLIKDMERADILLEAATGDQKGLSSLKSELAALRSNIIYWLLIPEDGMALIDQVLNDSPVEHECVRSTALLAWAPLRQMMGKNRYGERPVWDRLEDGEFRHPSSRARLLQSMCLTAWPESDTEKLHLAATSLLEISLDNDLTWAQSFARYFLGLIHYERNELNEAITHLEVVFNDPYRYPIQNLTHCSYLLSLAYWALGQTKRASEIADSIASISYERSNEMFIALSIAFKAELDLRQNRRAQAYKWAGSFTLPVPHSMQRYFNAEFVAIKVLLDQGSAKSLKTAAEQLDSLHEILAGTHHSRLMIDVLGMKAILANSRKRKDEAVEYLRDALELAEAGEFVRPFLDMGKPMHELIRRLSGQQPEASFTRRILDLFNTEEQGRLDRGSDSGNAFQDAAEEDKLRDPLTKREIDILRALSERISNDQIAEKLFISTETVKRHLYNIYQKLDVKNRQQAIERAQSLGL